MEKILETVASQVPSLVVLVLMVNMFLNRDKEHDAIAQMNHQEHLEARALTRKALDANTDSHLRVVEAIKALEVITQGILGWRK